MMIAPTAEPDTADRTELDSYVYAQTIDALLRFIPICAAPFGGDVTRMMVFYGAARSSVGHLNHRNQLRAEAEGGIFPDDLRRAVSVLSISEYLALPYETVRRHVHELVEQKLLERQGSRSFFVSSETMKREGLRDCVKSIAPKMAELATRIHTTIAEKSVDTAGGNWESFLQPRANEPEVRAAIDPVA